MLIQGTKNIKTYMNTPGISHLENVFQIVRLGEGVGARGEGVGAIGEGVGAIGEGVSAIGEGVGWCYRRLRWCYIDIQVL